jgi:hypothetical protein
MIYIAHRGLFGGPDVDLENRPEQIELALSKGYHAEIDVWFSDNRWYLGHDFPDYEIRYEFLEQPNLWIHAKNLDALRVLRLNDKLNYFWHQSDDYIVTSKGNIWTQPGRPLSKDNIMVMPESIDKTLSNTLDVNCLAICSDYVELIKQKREQ